MGNNLKFNSSVCTTREQSLRLLALGLKPETADMNWTITDSDREGNEYSVEYMSIGQGAYQLIHPNWYIPAWSLHRLMEIGNIENAGFADIKNAYETCISMISSHIKFGLLNKEYLKQ